MLSRFKGIFFPFLAWSIIQYLFKMSGALSPAPADWEFSVHGFLTLFMSNQIDGTYWFFFSMLGVTLSIPVLSKLRNETSTLWYMVLTFAVLTGFMQPICRMFDVPWNNSIGISVAGGYVMYAVLGYLLSTEDGTFFTKKRRRVVYALGIAAFAVRYGYTWLTSQTSGELNTALFDYSNFAGILPAASVFLFAKNVSWSKFWISSSDKGRQILKTVAGASFGIYLMHSFVLNSFLLQFIPMNLTSYMFRFAFPFLVFAICCVISLVLNRIPVVRGIVGGWR